MARFPRLLASLIGVALCGISACGGGSDDTGGEATMAAVGSPSGFTPSSGSCPTVATVCTFARQLSAWLHETDADAIFEHSTPTEVACNGATVGGGTDPKLPLCAGASPGEVRAGYPVGRLQSEGGTLGEPLLTEWLQTRFGSDAPTRELELAAIGCPIAEQGGPPDCDEAFSVIFRAPEDAVPQSLLQITVETGADGPRIRRYYSGLIAANPQMVEGGTTNETLIDPSSVGTRYQQYSP
jgi:hypothetical protein